MCAFRSICRSIAYYNAGACGAGSRTRCSRRNRCGTAAARLTTRHCIHITRFLVRLPTRQKCYHCTHVVLHELDVHLARMCACHGVDERLTAAAGIVCACGRHMYPSSGCRGTSEIAKSHMSLNLTNHNAAAGKTCRGCRESTLAAC